MRTKPISLDEAMCEDCGLEWADYLLPDGTVLCEECFEKWQKMSIQA